MPSCVPVRPVNATPPPRVPVWVEGSAERHQDVGYEERHVVGERLDAGAQAEHAGVPRRAARRHACRSGDGTHYMQAKEKMARAPPSPLVSHLCTNNYALIQKR